MVKKNDVLVEEKKLVKKEKEKPIFEKEVDMGFFETYLESNNMMQCRRPAYCSCDCDRCTCLADFSFNG